jgi:hypothetical protein
MIQLGGRGILQLWVWYFNEIGKKIKNVSE